jgi:hypothetical protein
MGSPSVQELQKSEFNLTSKVVTFPVYRLEEGVRIHGVFLEVSHQVL